VIGLTGSISYLQESERYIQMAPDVKVMRVAIMLCMGMSRVQVPGQILAIFSSGPPRKWLDNTVKYDVSDYFCIFSNLLFTDHLII
jgi:hypothetical protein